ncbi:MAG: energy transducer TonB [Nitrospirota bacterium]|nr:energy transducer TonB [Nitrospirota bacterium]
MEFWIMAGLTALIILCAGSAGAAEGDAATHQADHAEDAVDVVLPDVHVHGVPLNKDQQLGPVPTYMPWPKIPSSLDGQELDDWMKARFLVSKEARVTVVVLEPCKHRELTGAGLAALNKWTFDPQLKGDEPVDGEITVRIHFRTK